MRQILSANKAKSGKTSFPVVFKKSDQDDLMALQLVKKGKSSAFAHIMDKYYDVLLIKIETEVRDHDQAKDILQDIFIKVYSNLDRYEKRFTFNAWISRVAQNHLIDVLRKKKASKEINETGLKRISNSKLSGENSNLDLSNFADADADSFSQESYEDIHSAQYIVIQNLMNELDEQDQAILTLFYIERKRQIEISSLLGLTHVHVRVRLNRLKKILKNRFVGESVVITEKFNIFA